MFDSKDVIMLRQSDFTNPKLYMTDSSTRFKDINTIRKEQNTFGSRKTSTASSQIGVKKFRNGKQTTPERKAAPSTTNKTSLNGKGNVST